MRNLVSAFDPQGVPPLPSRLGRAVADLDVQWCGQRGGSSSFIEWSGCRPGSEASSPPAPPAGERSRTPPAAVGMCAVRWFTSSSAFNWRVGSCLWVTACSMRRGARAGWFSARPSARARPRGRGASAVLVGRVRWLCGRRRPHLVGLRDGCSFRVRYRDRPHRVQRDDGQWDERCRCRLFNSNPQSTKSKIFTTRYPSSPRRAAASRR